jgi:hypothetical protein
MCALHSRRKGYDLNTLLQVANASALVAGVYAYRIAGGNDYVDVTTLYAACVLGLSNVVMLRYERRRKDPFIVILVTMTVLFHVVRVATLFAFPWSQLMDEVGTGPHEVTRAMIFIASGNLAMFAGFAMAERRAGAGVHHGPSSRRLPRPSRIVLMLVLSMILGQLVSSLGILGRVAGFVQATLLNTYFLVLIAVLYLSMCGRRLPRIYAGMIIGLVAFVFLKTVLGGSRAALLEVAVFGLIAVLVQDGRTRVGLKVLVVGLTLCVSSPFFYFTATYLREIPQGEERSLSLDAITSLEATAASSVPNRQVLFPRMFARLGYVDHVTAIMAGRAKYKEVVGIGYLIESTMDNVLSPGFDVFDRPKVALVLGSLYRGARQAPAKSALSVDEYGSEMMTVYGEAYLFFGYAGLIFLFVSAFAAKKVYLWYRSRHVFEVYAYRSLVLWGAYRWFSSYGMDWLLVEMMTAIIFFAAFREYCDWAGRSGPVILTEGRNVTAVTLPHSGVTP